MAVAVPPAKSAGGTSATHSTPAAGGQVMIGSALSATVIVAVQVSDWPHWSVTVSVTGVSPST